MSNQQQQTQRPNRGGMSAKPAPMTTAAREAMKAQQQGQAPPKPYKMPEVEVGEIVMYQDGFYNRNAQGSAAVVTEVGPRTIELSVFVKEAPNIRILGSAVRYKDDPEIERLARANAGSEEPEGFGTWYREDWMLTPGESRSLKLLLDIYSGELEEFAKSGTINGKPLGGDKPPA